MKNANSDVPVPPRLARLLAAVAVGATCGFASWLVATHLPLNAYQDFAFWRRAARAVLEHDNPYAIVRGANQVPFFLYPLPSALAIIPLTWIPASLGGALFVGSSCALLAFAVTANAWWPLLMFLSGSMVLTVRTAQASAWLTAALFVPSLTWMGVFKPNIGLAILAYRPSWKHALIMIAIAGLSLLVMPTWPREWIATASRSPYHFAAWRVPGGVLLFAVLSRWRRPEARLIAMLALVPSSPIVYETLPLFVVPRTKQQMILLVILTNVMFLLTASISLQRDTQNYLDVARPAIVALVYAPAALMVMLRPNEGTLPTWLENRVTRLPSWLRGTPIAAPAAR